MDGINPLLSGHHPSTSLLKKDQTKTEKKKTAAFQRVLGSSEDKSTQSVDGLSIADLDKPEELEAWIDQIFEKGEILKNDPTLNSLGEYKKAVGHFLKHVTSRGYKVQKSKGVMNPRTFKQKEFVNVEVINRKLESLAAYVLSTQKEQLEVLRRVDEINGLIVDYIG